jgi:hypothetical protein
MESDTDFRARPHGVLVHEPASAAPRLGLARQSGFWAVGNYPYTCSNFPDAAVLTSPLSSKQLPNGGLRRLASADP